MSTVLTKPVLLDETGQSIVTKLDEIKDAVSVSGEYTPLALRITTPPTKTSYLAGERLDLSGIVVCLVGSNNSLIDVTSACTFVPANRTVLHASNTSVAITYHYAQDDLDFTATQNISVADFVSIEVTTPPTKVTYYDGDALDLTGIVVKAVADNGEKIDVTNQCVFSPANGSTVTLVGSGASEEQTITITYHWEVENIDFTTTQTIIVNWVYITNLEILTPPTKTEYLVGDTLDLTGLTARATFVNGATAVYGPSDLESIPANGSVLNDASLEYITIGYTTGGIFQTDTQSITVVEPIFGVEWDGTATTSWSRTDSASDFTDPIPAENNGNGSSPFDNILPWSGMKIVEDVDAGTLVSIPKYYYKWTKDGAKIKLQISPMPQTGFHVSPAHADRGDGQGERDIVYVGRYISRSFAPNNYKSVTNSYPTYDSKTSFRTSIHALGNEIWLWDIAMYFTITMLYLVEYADWNSQAKIGNGGGSGDTGNTDAMIYHTGSSGNRHENTNDYAHVQYRHIEDLWGYKKQWLDGIYCYTAYPSARSYYCTKNPSDFADASGGTKVSTKDVGSGWISSYRFSEVTGFEYLLTPNAYSGGDGQYVCDKAIASDTSGGDYADAIMVGGASQNQEVGLFYWQTDYQASHSGTGFARLMKLPANT